MGKICENCDIDSGLHVGARWCVLAIL
jgi:hypothetical protein